MERTRHQGEFGGLFPKTAGLPGSLHLEWRRCGKPTCHCARGGRHGPYLVRVWYEEGRRRKQYVSRAQVPAVAAAVARWRELHPPLWSTRQALAELRALAKEIQT